MPETTDTADYFCLGLFEMIDLCHPLAVLASHLSWAHFEATLALLRTVVRANRMV